MIRITAQVLGLAAGPAFAVMAVLAYITSGGASPICGAAPAASPLADMASMYVLMSLFHAAPWLRLAARGPTGAPRDDTKVSRYQRRMVRTQRAQHMVMVAGPGEGHAQQSAAFNPEGRVS